MPRKQRRKSLTLELVPASMWRINIRALVADNTWDALRWSFGATRDLPPCFFAWEMSLPTPNEKTPIECRICGAQEDRLELHEKWQYDDKHRIQRLVDLIPLCHNCHLSFHFGRADQLGLGEKVKRHIAKINHWDKRQTDKHLVEAFNKWRLRSQYPYSLDLNWLYQWIPKSKVHFDWLENPRHWTKNKVDWLCRKHLFVRRLFAGASGGRMIYQGP
ncbi:MAG: hypothetical protein IT443_05440 [Phycisphaeraceae bacterium]|nr:hypothetical protein [Phycisphaeraceae bacterium]